MPYPNEHAARIRDPGEFDRLRRKNDEFGDGIDVIYGIKNGTSFIQAIRFRADKWTVEEAKQWLKDHDYKPLEFEPAIEEMSMAKPGICQIMVTGESYHGKDHIVVTEEIIDKILENFNRRGDAQMEIKLEDHESKIAAGWILGLAKVSDGDDIRLMAVVKWTEEAADLILADKLRYISPEFSYHAWDKETGGDQGPTLFAAALLNNPHFENQPVVMAIEDYIGDIDPEKLSEIPDDLKTIKLYRMAAVEIPKPERQGDDDMKKELKKLLGLSEDATDEQIMEVLRAHTEKVHSLEAAQEEVKNLSAQVEQLKAGDGKNTVALAQYNELQERVKNLEAERARTEAEKAVDDVISEGRATPAMKEELVVVYLQNAETAKKLLANLPKIVDVDKATGNAGSNEPVSLSEIQLTTYHKARSEGKTADEAMEIAIKTKE